MWGLGIVPNSQSPIINKFKLSLLFKSFFLNKPLNNLHIHIYEYQNHYIYKLINQKNFRDIFSSKQAFSLILG